MPPKLCQLQRQQHETPCHVPLQAGGSLSQTLVAPATSSQACVVTLYRLLSCINHV